MAEELEPKPEESVFWTIKDPDGYLIHTVISLDKDDAVKEYMDGEKTIHLICNTMRERKGIAPKCTPSWEYFESEGYTAVQIRLVEV